jgi:uncharacterized protein
MNSDAAKIVFAGPVGAGKTSAITAVSDSPPLSTEVPLLADTGLDLDAAKTTTTLALDFSTVALADGTVVQVFGLPGQDYLDFMRPILLEGAIGVILLLNGRSPRLEADCRDWLESLHGINDGLPILIGITQTEHAVHFNLPAIRRLAAQVDHRLPVLTLDAREPEQCRQLLRALLANSLAGT